MIDIEKLRQLAAAGDFKAMLATGATTDQILAACKSLFEVSPDGRVTKAPPKPLLKAMTRGLSDAIKRGIFDD